MKMLLMSIALLSSTTAFAATTAPNYDTNDLLVTTTVRVQAGTEAAFRAAGLEILAPTRQESGNDGYELFQDPKDPTRFTTVEHWRSQADIDRHLNLPHMQKFFSVVGGMFEPGFPVLTTYQNVERR